MKYLTFKRVFSLLIIITIGVTLGIYFLGGMKISSYDLDNIEFNEEEFIDFTSSGEKGIGSLYYRIDGKGKKIVDDSGKPIEVKFAKNIVIGQSDKYVMLFDEETTIAKVVKKLPGDGPNTDYSEHPAIYQSARDEANTQGANLVVRYAQKANGKKATNGLDTVKYSTSFENSLTGQLEKHYKIRYLENDQGLIDGVQILYEIGKFSANLDYFPVAFEKADYTTAETEEEQAEIDYKNRNTLEERLRGNTIFQTVNKPQYNAENKVAYYVRSYTGTGFTYSEAAANYIEEHQLAIVEPQLDHWQLSEISPELYDGFGTHINASNSPITMNPFLPNEIFTKIKTYYGGSPLDVEFTEHKVYSLVMRTSGALSSLYSYLYEENEFKDISSNTIPIVDEEGNPIIIGGFHERDIEGNFVYNEDGTPKRQLYTLDLVAQDNDVYGFESATSLERFQVGLQLKLTDNGILATVMGNTLKDSDHSKVKNDKYDHGYIMYALEILPELTTVRDENAQGMMIIPDGSGAIINFNNQKAVQNYSPYTANVYGFDHGFTFKTQPEQTETLMFGMYGFIDFTGNRGLINIVEKGAAQSILKADTPRGSSPANYIYYTTTIRQDEAVAAGTGWYTSEFMKWAKNLSYTDLQYNYMFLDETELSYVGVANKYRNYLIERYNLEAKDTTKDNVIDINFLGAFERYSLFLGIKYMSADSLTTFNEAQQIVQELLDNEVVNMSVSYTSWTNKELEYETTYRLKVSNALGKAKSMKQFNNYLTTNNINFYPEMYISSSKGYKYAFGEMKYTAKSVGNFYARQYPFDLSTLMPDKKLEPTYYINPGFYNAITNNLLKSYDKLNINGAKVMDLGNNRIGNYARDKEIYPYVATIYQTQALEQIKNSIDNIKISAPFDYAFPYVNTAIDVPMTSSAYGIFDATIPFYQLVVSGLFDYSTDTINGLTDKSTEWYFIKALETGSNLQFIISYEDPKILLDTDYTQYYKSYYQNWKDNIIDMNSRINAAGIHNGRLINHEILSKDVAKVTYSNGLKLVINASTSSYKYKGRNIDSYSYIILGGE